MKDKILIQDTVTHTTQKSIDNMFLNNNIAIDNYKYMDYTVQSVLLRGTIYDIHSLWNEKAKARESFFIDGESEVIGIPNFFVKINGVFEDKKKQKELEKILTEDSVVFRDFHVCDVHHFHHGSMNTKNIYDFIKDGNFSIEKIQKFINMVCEYKDYFKYEQNIINNLNKSVVNNIVHALNVFYKAIRKEIWKSLDDYNEEYLNFILSVIFMKDDIISQVNKWDYSSSVPKIVIYDEYVSEKGNISDYLMVDFLNYIGLDIAIICPSARSSIELFEFSLNDSYLTRLVLDKFLEPSKVSYEDKCVRKGIITVISAIAGIVIVICLIIKALQPVIEQRKEDKRMAHIDSVELMIDNIGEVTLDKHDVIFNTYTEYEKLVEEDKLLVDNKNVLIDAVDKYYALDNESKIKEKIQTIIKDIDGLSTYNDENVSIYSYAKDINDRYESLSAPEKELVTNYEVLKEFINSDEYVSHTSPFGTLAGSLSDISSLVFRILIMTLAFSVVFTGFGIIRRMMER